MAEKYYLEALPTVTGTALRDRIKGMADPTFEMVSTEPAIPYMKHERDRTQRRKKIELSYDVPKPPVMVEGIVQLDIPLPFLTNSFNIAIKDYKFFKGKEECDLPNDILGKLPFEERFKSHKECKDKVEEFKADLKKHGIKPKLNHKTLRTDFAVKFASIVGEHIGAYLWKEHLEEMSTGEGTSDFDLVIKGEKVDVKTKYRPKSQCLYYYQATVPVYQLRTRCDFYICVNIMHDMDKAMVIGGAHKDYYRNNGEPILYKTPLYNAPGRIYDCNVRSFQYNELPKWGDKQQVLEFYPTVHPQTPESVPFGDIDKRDYYEGDR